MIRAIILTLMLVCIPYCAHSDEVFDKWASLRPLNGQKDTPIFVEVRLIHRGSLMLNESGLILRRTSNGSTAIFCPHNFYEKPAKCRPIVPAAPWAEVWKIIGASELIRNRGDKGLPFEAVALDSDSLIVEINLDGRYNSFYHDGPYDRKQAEVRALMRKVSLLEATFRVSLKLSCDKCK